MKLLSLVTFNLKIDARFSFLLGKTFLTLEKLVTALEYGEVDGILVDLYTASYRSDLFNVTWIVISQIIPFEFTSGAVISRNAGKLEKHFRDYIETKGTVAVTEVLKKRTNEEKKENKVSVTFLKIPVQKSIQVLLWYIFAMLCNWSIKRTRSNVSAISCKSEINVETWSHTFSHVQGRLNVICFYLLLSSWVFWFARTGHCDKIRSWRALIDLSFPSRLPFTRARQPAFLCWIQEHVSIKWQYLFSWLFYFWLCSWDWCITRGIKDYRKDDIRYKVNRYRHMLSSEPGHRMKKFFIYLLRALEKGANLWVC